jgi:hypothetical protein
VTGGLLLRLYPRAWRLRYGAELQELIVETSGGGRIPWRVRLDVAAGAVRERLRAGGLAGDPPPGERTRGGALLVLCAWTIFVVGGVVVQKFSEHWQGAVPAGARGLPSAAFDVLIGAAAFGTVLVLAGIAAALPALVRFLGDGGWLLVRRHVVVAGALTVAAGGGGAVLIWWAHGLTEAQRNGADSAYTAAAAVAGLVLLACLAAWTIAAVACARRLHLPHGVLVLEASLATGAALAMLAMTAATAIWWGAVARHAQPSFFGQASPLAPQMLLATALMLTATVSGAFGARHALGGVRS